MNLFEEISKNIDKSTQKMCKEIEEFQGWKGNLVLYIACTDCNAEYELNHESIACAMLTNACIWEYIKFVQNSTCPVCKPKKETNN